MRQKFGQNFLWDKNIARKLVTHLNIQQKDVVIEIGAGKGILTEQVLAHPIDKLIAVEIDRKLVQELTEKFSGNKKLEIVNSDFLKINLKGLLQKLTRPPKFLGNLPYSLATAIVQKVIAELPPGSWQRAVFTLQKEVAEKILNPKKLNYLKIFVWHYCRVKPLFDIPPQAFSPKPKVTSSSVVLEPADNILPDTADIELAKKIFSHRRKTLLKAMVLSGFPPVVATKILNQANIAPTIRAEDLSLDEFLLLTKSSKKDIIG